MDDKTRLALAKRKRRERRYEVARLRAKEKARLAALKPVSEPAVTPDGRLSNTWAVQTMDAIKESI